MQILKAGMLYFVFVFGAGFLLGPIRILWVVRDLAREWLNSWKRPSCLSSQLWQRGGSFGDSLCRPQRRVDSVWVALRLACC